MKALLLGLALFVVPQAALAHETYTVIGDSHAKGVAFGIHRVRPEAWVSDLSVGGTGSWQMPVAPDDGSFVAVSAGTVDCGTRDPDDKMVMSILRVLGPFADGKQQKGGSLVFVIPHDRLRGHYAYVNPRITQLRVMLQMALDVRRVPYVTMDTDPGSDGVHLDPDGYVDLAKLVLAAGPKAQPTGPTAFWKPWPPDAYFGVDFAP